MHRTALPPMLRTVLPLLRCPQCSAGQESLLQLGEREIGCAAGHRFDAARQGYLPLLGGASRTGTGDSAAMVAARADFLDRGHYAPIARSVAEATGSLIGGTPDPVVCEIGAGTAYYLSAGLPPTGRGIALDSSRYASRRAAAADPRVAAVLADAWAPLPVASGMVDVTLVVFAPRVAAEIARIVRGSGGVVVVTPNPGHLGEVRGPLGMLAVDDGKDEAVRAQFDGLLRVSTVDRVRAEMSLDSTDLRDLVGMGPAARHRTPEQIAAAATGLGGPVAVHLDVTVTQLVGR